jgi:hypothetical protein
MSTAAKIEAALSQGFLALKNAMQVARWRWKWALQGGSMHWAARNLQDQRTGDQLKDYAAIEVKRKHARTGPPVVNLAARRINRARRQTAHRA